MKFIRLFLACLVVALVLVAVLVLAAIAPATQTWYARMKLSSRPGLKGSLESLSAGFGEVDVEGLRMEVAGAVLTLPSLQAKLPLTVAVLRRRAEVGSLVARGWTLDLSRAPERADAPVDLADAGAVSAEAARAFLGVLSRLRLPFDGSMDGVELEGDVVLARPPGTSAVQVHLTITGGGMASGKDGAFDVDALATVPGSAFNAVDAHGRVVVAMDSPRTFNRLEIKAAVSGLGGSRQSDVTLAGVATAARGAGVETYTVELARGSRNLAAVTGRFSLAARRVTGTWNVDLVESDMAPFALGRTLPSISAKGHGDFDADAAFARVHALGSITAAASRLGALAAPLERLGAVTLETRFDLARSGRSIRFDQLDIALAGDRPAASVRSLQPFELDERTGSVKVADPAGDWLGVSIRGLPLAWLSGLAEGLTVTGGDATGEFAIAASNGGFALRPKTPLAAAGVSVQSAGRVIGRGLDLSLSLAADYAPKGWQVQWEPLTIDGAGRRLAATEGKASRPAGADEPIGVAGTWTADLEALASQAAIPALAWSAARSASGDFSASVGTSKEVEGKVAVLGRDPGHSLVASVHADIDSDDVVTFAMPIKIAFGSSVSELSAEGTWSGEKAGNWVDAKLTGGDVSLEQLRVLAAPIAAAGGVALPKTMASGADPRTAPEVARDRIPFWGDWSGHVTVAFDRVRTGDDGLSFVGGSFDVDRGSIHLKSGRGGLGRHVLTGVEGSISFDAAADFPYILKATAPVVNDIDAAPLFAAQVHGDDPIFEGHFSLATSLSGKGINLIDLVGRTQAEFRVTSSAGIVRLLRTSVADAIPEGSSPVSDTLGTVGYAVGTLLGIKGDASSSGNNPMSKNAEAVLDFTNQVEEIGYDQITVAGFRDSGGTIHLSQIEMTSPDVRLNGSGQITRAKGLPVFKQPLSVELQLGARGKVAELLSTARLLAPQKDKLGYAVLNQSIHFGGTLEQIDVSQWRELLVKAATRKPDGGKKATEGAGRPSP